MVLLVGFTAFAQSSYEEEQKIAQQKLEEGKRLQAAGNYLGAIQLLNEAINNNPDLWEAFYLLGICYESRQETLDAVDSYEQALEINPEIEGLSEHLNKLRFEEQTGQTYLVVGSAAAQARDYVEKARELWDAGRQQEAAVAIGTALRLNPALPEANFAAGYIYHKQGALSRAEKFYQAAASIKPDYKEALNNLGLVHMAQGYYLKALYDFSRVIELEYTYMSAYYNRAGAYAAQYDFETAIKELVKVIAQDDLDLDAHNDLALYYEYNGDITNAMKEWRKLLKLLDDPEAHSKSDSKQGLRAQAEDHLAKMAVYEEEGDALRLARQTRWRRVRASLSIGWAQVRMADFESEIIKWSEYLADDFELWLASYGLAGSTIMEPNSSVGGINFGGDIGCMLTRSLGVGVRERITMTRDTRVRITGVGETGQELRYEYGIGADFIAVMFGGWLEFGRPEKAVFRLSAFGGPLYAMVKYVMDYRLTDPSWIEPYRMWNHGSAKGSGIAFEGSGELAVPFSKYLFGVIEIGYRSARVGSMTYVWDVDGDEIKDDPLMDLEGERKLNFDFSGVVFSAGMRLSM